MDRFDAMQAEQLGRDATTLGGVLAATVRRPRRRLRNIIGAVAVAAVMLFAGLVVVNHERGGGGEAASCAYPMQVQWAMGGYVRAFSVVWAVNGWAYRNPFCAADIYVGCYDFNYGARKVYYYIGPGVGGGSCGGGGGGSW